MEEYNRITQSASFNGTPLFQGTTEGVRIQTGFGVQGSLLLGLGQELARVVGKGAFSSGYVGSMGESPAAVVAEDFNHDGKLDLAAVASSSNEVLVRLGNGDGSFGSASSYNVSDNCLSMAAGDFNRDGNIDLASASNNDSNVTILLGNDDGGFGAGITFSFGSEPERMTVGDINADGFLDLISADQGDSTVSILFGQGNGSFGSAASIDVQAGARDVIVADYNADGVNDIAAVTDANEIVILAGARSGSPMLSSTIGLSAHATSIEASDLNLDGRQDIVIGDDSGHISVFLGKDGLAFATQQSYDSGSSESVILEDLNADGFEDIVSIGDNSAVFFGAGNGTFSLANNIQGTWGFAGATGDFDSDGVLDLAMAMRGNNEAAIFIQNKETSATAAHINITTRQGALQAMSVIDENLNRIQKELGRIGAATSRLSVALATLQSSCENEAAAFSRITDADVAEESAQLVKSQIVQQVGAAILAQANNDPQIALQLLR